MSDIVPLGGRVAAQRLAHLLGDWRHPGSRRGTADLAAGVRLLVLDGLLPVGTALPAERELADALAVSRTLVASAYARLRAEGFLISRRGAGSWTALPAGAGTTRAGDPLAVPEMIDFARAVPAAVPGIAAAVDAVRHRLVAELSGHGYYELGLPELRDRIAQRYTARGLPTTTDQVLITNGSHQGLALALRTLTGPGDRVLVEQPTYPNALDAVRAANAIPVPVAMGEEGWDLDGVEAVLRQSAPRLAYLIVDFQNPTGLRLDAEGRERLGAALRRTRTPVLVDETHVELDLDGDPLDGPPPLAAHAPELAIAAGSVSKSHWGGFRLGWLRASADLVNRLTVARRSLDLGSPVLDQLVVAELLAGTDRLPAQRREQLVAQRDALAGALRTRCPQWSFRLPQGGLSLWCRLPAPMSSRLAVSAQNFGVWVVPAARFSPQGGLEGWLRVPYTQPVEVLVDGVRRLSQAATAVLESAPSPRGDRPIPVA